MCEREFAKEGLFTFQVQKEPEGILVEPQDSLQHMVCTIAYSMTRLFVYQCGLDEIRIKVLYPTKQRWNAITRVIDGP